MNPVLGFQADILCDEGRAYLGIDLICRLRWLHLPLPHLLHELCMQPLALLNLRQDQIYRIALDQIIVPVARYALLQGFARAEAWSNRKVRVGLWREEGPLSITCPRRSCRVESAATIHCRDNPLDLPMLRCRLFPVLSLPVCQIHCASP